MYHPMRSGFLQALVVLSIGVVFWIIVNMASGTREPWDAEHYWTFAYPLALALSTGLGFVLRSRSWLTGALLMLAQLPVMIANTGAGPLILVGLMFLCVLAIPAIITAWLGARFRNSLDRA